MKRDNDLIKRMLLTAEESDGRVTFTESSVPDRFPEDYAFDVIRYHFTLLEDRGLIKGSATNTSLTILHLTWEGHDFLDDARNDTLWNAAKRNAGKLSFTAFREVVKELAKTAAGLALQASLQQNGLG